MVRRDMAGALPMCATSTESDHSCPDCEQELCITDARRTASGVTVTTKVARGGLIRGTVMAGDLAVNLGTQMRRVGRGEVTMRMPVNAMRTAPLRAELVLEQGGVRVHQSREVN